MQRKTGNKGDIYYHITENTREWVNPGSIPTFRKMFAEMESMNKRLDRIEASLVKFADTHALSNDGTLESVLEALMNEIQVVQAGKAYVAVQTSNGYITKSIKADVILENNNLPQDLDNSCYKIEGGFVVLDQDKLNEMEEI